MVTPTQIIETTSSIIANAEFMSTVNIGKRPRDYRMGGFLTIFDGMAEPHNAPIVCTMVGSIRPESFERCFKRSFEQSQRLLSYPHHLSSSQTRDPLRNQFGGAIRLTDFILSFDGFEEMENEALMIIVAAFLELQSQLILGEIANLSNVVPVIRKLREATRNINKM